MSWCRAPVALKMANMNVKLHCLGAALCALAWLLPGGQPVVAQDILRRTPQLQQANPLDSIQLPPQLASLTPQQLHQLAQLRELQLQQEAAKQQDMAAAVAMAQQQHHQQQQHQQQHPRQSHLAESVALPTAQPAAAQASGQIPQPGAAAGAETTPANNERHDDGSYNESGSEMEGVAMSAGGAPLASNDKPTAAAANDSANSAAAASAPTFEVNWNKCPQLEPSEGEKSKKTQVITKCLQAAPIPNNLTRENVEAHREQIATCALKVEGWFDEQGQYKYDKAESEIRGKKLDAVIETQVLKFHVACKDEASKKFPRDQNKLIDQVQFYQACMDYYISIVCEIEVSVDQ